MREEESELVLIPSDLKVMAVARNTCHPDRVYIITGGLGGFGLELANWLVERGKKNLLYITSVQYAICKQVYSWYNLLNFIDTKPEEKVKNVQCSNFVSEEIVLFSNPMYSSFVK